MFGKLEQENDTKQIYGAARKIMNWKNGNSPRSFLINGTLVRKPVELATAQMAYYTKKVKTLMDNLPISQDNPLKWLIRAKDKWSGSESLPTFNFCEVTRDETIGMIGKLNNSMAYGIDFIDSLSVKLVTQHLADPLRHLINVSLKQKKFANRWKLAKLSLY